MKQKEPTVDLTLNLGRALKIKAERAAKEHGVTLNEFIVNIAESRIRVDREYDTSERTRVTPHGGKHLFGKHTGYEVTKDGKYYPAPSWTQQFEQLFAERQAIHSLADSLMRLSQERLIAVEKNIAAAKDKMIDDLGLDPAQPWVYYGQGGRGYLEIAKSKEKETGDDGSEQAASR